MRPLFRSAPLWLALAHGAGLAAPGDAVTAADPATPVPSLRQALPDPQRLDAPEPPADLQQALAAWREANARVADFPRGHIDLLRWEKAHAPSAAATDADTPSSPTMAFGEALRASLRQRPELFTHRDMGPLERDRVRVAYAAHVRELRLAWIDAVAQRERERLARAALDATRAGTELGRRMVRAGNWPQARLMQEQLTEAQAWRAASDAALGARAAAERLAGELGLWRANEVEALAARLPSTLPEPPAALDGPDAAGAEAAALAAHPLLAIERERAGRRLRGVGTDRWAAWDAARDSALAALAEPGAGRGEPPHLDDTRLLRDQRWRDAEHERATLLRAAAERRSMVRQAWLQRHASHANARHAERVVRELRAGLQRESLLRYNGMLDSTWQLLASAREHSAAVDAAIAARRGFWRSEAAWQALLAGADFTPDTPSASAADGTDTPEGH